MPALSLTAEACHNRDDLQRFVVEHIGINAWPIHSPALLRNIETEGLNLTLAHPFALEKPQMVALMHHMYRMNIRVERRLGIHNAFHCAMHNFEVLIRLLVLEWPVDVAMPTWVEQAPQRVYRALETALPVALAVIDALQEQRVPGSTIARDLLTALGHDYGHTGGTDRLDADGRMLPLSHEDMSEKHVALVGMRFGYPTALILESMAGIRATTFHHRPGRPRVQPANLFEHRITLADVMGCALPPDQWLTHVAVPVLFEKIPHWKRRSIEIAMEEHSLDPNALLAERAGIISDIGEWFHSEHGFFVFIEAFKLRPIPGAHALWGVNVQQKMALVERVLSRTDLLAPLVAQDSSLLEQFACQLCNVTDLKGRLDQGDIDTRLRELLRPFVEVNDERH
jgi:hypothetical protein